MNIQLPENFFYSNDWKRLAYVEDGVLYVEGDVNFENLMYSLAYQISGYHECAYCGRKLTKETRTLDHIYPRSWGGISIPDNLAPCCANCNSEKNNMNFDQFERWKSLPADERHEMYVKFVKQNEEQMKTEYLLPYGWVTSFEIAEVINELDFSTLERFGNEKIDLYYELHGYYPRPIVVSANNWVFKGIHILYHAKLHGIKTISCVRLDNVIRVK